MFHKQLMSICIHWYNNPKFLLILKHKYCRQIEHKLLTCKIKLSSTKHRANAPSNYRQSYVKSNTYRINGDWKWHRCAQWDFNMQTSRSNDRLELQDVRQLQNNMTLEMRRTTRQISMIHTCICFALIHRLSRDAISRRQTIQLVMPPTRISQYIV